MALPLKFTDPEKFKQLVLLHLDEDATPGDVIDTVLEGIAGMVGKDITELVRNVRQLGEIDDSEITEEDVQPAKGKGSKRGKGKDESAA